MTLRSLYSGVSGLKVHQNRMDVLGNNIANVNTVGYKASRVTFSDLFSQTLRGHRGGDGSQGAINPLQIGLGVKTASVDTIFSQGSFQVTDRLFDLAIAGNGFFVLSDSANVTSGQQYLTRAGNFNVDNSGYLVNPSTGYVVVGRPADAFGNITDSQGLEAIRIDKNMTDPAQSTRNIHLGGNINSQPEPAAAQEIANVRHLFTSDGTPLNLQIGDVIQIDGGTVGTGVPTDLAGTALLTIKADTTLNDIIEALNTAIKAVDDRAAVTITETGKIAVTAGQFNITNLQIGLAAGNDTAREAVANAQFDKIFNDGTVGIDAATGGGQVTGTDWFRRADLTTSIDVYDSQGNARTVSVSMCRVTASATPNNQVSYQIAVPTVNGNDAGGNGSFATGTTGTLDFNSDGTLATSSVASLIFDPDGTFPVNGGVDPMNINLDISGLTQYFAPNTAAIESQDGRAQGNLDTLTIDEAGVIRGIFDNGRTRDLAQIMLGKVANEEGLTKVGDSMFIANGASGLALINAPTLQGRGSIASGSLELSNVDLAAEFTNMIITQRGFQANSRVITTGDEMLQDLVRIK